MTADPLALGAELDRSTARLMETVHGLDDDAVAAPSLLPGWSRGHVLTHLARNADGLVNLVTWARTGVETPQYASWERREADIAAGAVRGAAELADDVRASAERLAAAVRDAPPAAWAATVRWTSGEAFPAARILWARWREVEVHHVDLAAGYSPAGWPAAFTLHLLRELAARRAPVVRLRADDLGYEVTIGDDDGAPLVAGPAHALAAWLTGRATGDGLGVTPAGALPPVPVWK